MVTGPLVSPLSCDRLRGTSSVARTRGNDDLVVVGGDFTVESGAEAADRLLNAENRPTAIFCCRLARQTSSAKAAIARSSHGGRVA